MTTAGTQTGCAHTDHASEYAVGTLPVGERADFEAHVRGCAECRAEVEALQPIVDAWVDWPTDLLTAPVTLWDTLAERIGIAASGEVAGPPSVGRSEWSFVAPGISYQTLAKDVDNQRISMLVRLAPDVPYPPHRHAGVEELYLLDGELWIDDRKLQAGDYYRAEHGSEDRHVWSETGCTCVLMTSLLDVLR